MSVRSGAIDSLRGAAIGVVLLLHFALSYGLSDSALGDLLGREAVRTLVRNGNYGVTVFFAVSGYLITSMALARYGAAAQLQWRDFARRRLTRIAPPLLLALAVIVPLGLAGHPSFDNLRDGQSMGPGFMALATLSVLTFWHNLLMGQAGYFNYALNIYWSLSVEEAFYLALPLLCLAAGALTRRGQARAAQCLLGGAIGLCLAVSPLYRSAHADDEILFMYGNLACADALALGCLSAWLARRHPLAAGWPARALVAVAVVALVGVYGAGIVGHETWGFSGIAAATAAILWASPSLRPGGRGLAALSAPLRWLGRHSYELYLFHIVVLGLMREALPRSQVGHDLRLPVLALFLALSAALAAAVARWVSAPWHAR